MAEEKNILEPSAFPEALIEETGQPREEQGVQGEPAQEPGEQTPVPDKFRGKSQTEILKSYEELERKLTQVSQENSESRKRGEEYNREMLKLQQQMSYMRQTPPPALPATPPQQKLGLFKRLIENPDSADEMIMQQINLAKEQAKREAVQEMNRHISPLLAEQQQASWEQQRQRFHHQLGESAQQLEPEVYKRLRSRPDLMRDRQGWWRAATELLGEASLNKSRSPQANRPMVETPNPQRPPTEYSQEVSQQAKYLGMKPQKVNEIVEKLNSKQPIFFDE